VKQACDIILMQWLAVVRKAIKSVEFLPSFLEKRVCEAARGAVPLSTNIVEIHSSMRLTLVQAAVLSERQIVYMCCNCCSGLLSYLLLWESFSYACVTCSN
jgi:hypothetical protein